MNKQTITTAIKTTAAKLRSRFGRKQTVAGVVAEVEAKVNTLIDVATREAQAAGQADAQADKLREEAQAHRDEATKAVRVAGRFSALVK